MLLSTWDEYSLDITCIILHQQRRIILVFNTPVMVHILQWFLVIIQHYHGLQDKCVKVLIGLCPVDETQTSCHTSYHENVLTAVKELIARNIVLRYLDFNKIFEVDIDASKCQVGVVYFSSTDFSFLRWKLSDL